MKNKIVQLRDGKTTCRILDTIVSNGNTFYLVIDFDTKTITKIDPNQIFDIVQRDEGGEKYHSVKNELIKWGL